MPGAPLGRDVLGPAPGRPEEDVPVLHLPNGARVDGDEETVYTAVDDGQAGGDGLYAADVVEATGLDSARVTSALAVLVDREVLTTTVTDPELGPRYVRGTGL